MGNEVVGVSVGKEGEEEIEGEREMEREREMEGEREIEGEGEEREGMGDIEGEKEDTVDVWIIDVSVIIDDDVSSGISIDKVDVESIINVSVGVTDITSDSDMDDDGWLDMSPMATVVVAFSVSFWAWQDTIAMVTNSINRLRLGEGR